MALEGKNTNADWCSLEDQQVDRQFTCITFSVQSFVTSFLAMSHVSHSLKPLIWDQPYQFKVNVLNIESTLETFSDSFDN